MPRVIAGIAKGIPLKAPSGTATRPTLDRTKEAMFSAITARLDLDEARVVDFFAGSGQLGIEALSRGAVSALFIEKNRGARDIIKQNLAKTKMTDCAQIWGLDAKKALLQLIEDEKIFDLILLDPPYGEAKNLFLLLADLGLERILNTDGLVVLEHQSNEDAGEFVSSLQQYKRCKYGTAMVSFYGR